MIKSSSTSKRAFTLIELLVVIAIIAILAAILFPVFAQAKEAAKKSADLSNVKQLELSTLMYANDSDDIYPTLRNGPSNWGCNGATPLGNCHQVNSAHAVLDPYIKNRAIWTSPNDAMQRCDDVNQCTNDFTGGPVSYIFTYNGQKNVIVPNSDNSVAPYGFGIFGHAWAYSDGTPRPGTTGSLSTTGIDSPASTVAMYPMYISWTYWSGLMQYRADQRAIAFSDLGIPTWPQVLNVAYAWCCANDSMSMGAYSGITNFGWADGHARAMRREQLMDRLWLTDPATAVSTHAKNYIHVDGAYK